MAECYFCGKRTPQTQAVEEGWVPNFYRLDGDLVECEACPECAARHLTVGPDGEVALTTSALPVAEAVRVVAARYFKFPLDTQGSDALDFHEVSVWQLRDALTAAYRAGRAQR